MPIHKKWTIEDSSAGGAISCAANAPDSAAAMAVELKCVLLQWCFDGPNSSQPSCSCWIGSSIRRRYCLGVGCNDDTPPTFIRFETIP